MLDGEAPKGRTIVPSRFSAVVRGSLFRASTFLLVDGERLREGYHPVVLTVMCVASWKIACYSFCRFISPNRNYHMDPGDNEIYLLIDGVKTSA